MKGSSRNYFFPHIMQMILSVHVVELLAPGSYPQKCWDPEIYVFDQYGNDAEAGRGDPALRMVLCGFPATCLGLSGVTSV